MEANLETETEKPLEIKPKTHFKGRVMKVGLAGAVIDIGGGTPAAIHVSQITPPTNEPIKRVGDVLQVNQEIDVWVRKVKEQRIELTMIKPLDLEWREIKKGMSVKGTVVRMEKFGAFIEIGAERPGLVHISEITHGYIHLPNDVLKEGEEVEAEVLEVNRRKKQIKLSMKSLIPEPVKPAVDEKAFDGPKEGAKGKPNRRKKGKRSEDNEQDNGEFLSNAEAKAESETDTAMGIKLREALERSKSRSKQLNDKAKKQKSLSQEQEDILSRTLGHRSS